MIGLRWNMPNINVTIVHINIKLLDLSYKTWNKTIDMSLTLHAYRCKPWPGFTCVDVKNLVMNTKYNITVKLSSENISQDIFSKTIVAETKETSPSSVRDVNLKLISDSSMSLSWRIPLELNGNLRQFRIEVDHVSSLVKDMCCSTSVIDYLVSAEVEIYSHVLQDIKPASSYQITIRPLGKLLGPEVKQTIVTPPPRFPLQRQVHYSNKTVTLKQKENLNDDSIKIYKNLLKEVLVFVEPRFQTNSSSKEFIKFHTDEILGNKKWWLTHVCAAADETCTIDLRSQAKSTDSLPSNGRIEGESLQSEKQYIIVLVQVSGYKSTKSYTTHLYSICM
ncbi:hypothetical protein WDU94_006913 [Cyamophila willieti]